MSLLQQLAGRIRRGPRGTVRVVDPNPLNWLYITYNTVEEAVRVPKGGKVRPAAMSRYRWRDDRTLEIGTHFNIDRRTRAEVVDDRTVRLHLPEVDGLTLGKLRATHVMSERFWRDLG